MFAGSSISCLHQAQNVFVVDGRGESTHKPPNPSSQLLPAGHRWLDRGRKALVLAVRGFRRVWRLQNRLRRLSPSSTGFDPGADEAAGPSAYTLLLLAAELATTLLLAALGFPSKWLIVLLDHAKRDVGR